MNTRTVITRAELDGPRRESGGFSLIELITALAILTTGLIGAVHIYYRGLDAIQTVREKALVANALRNELETLRAAPFASLRIGASTAFVSVTPGLADLPNLKTGARIDDAFDPALRLKQITLTAEWTEKHGRPLRQSVTTLIADKEGR